MFFHSRLLAPHRSFVRLVAQVLVAATLLGTSGKDACGQDEAPAFPSAPEREAPTVSADQSIEENVKAVTRMGLEFHAKTGRGAYALDDPRRHTDAAFAKFDAGRRKILEMYKDSELSVEEQLALCRAFSTWGRDFAEETITCCRRAMDAAASETPPTASPEIAHWILGQTHYDLKRYDEAQKYWRDYLPKYCRPGRNENKQGYMCRDLLTHYLPDVYYRTENFDALVETFEDCSAFGFDGDRSLRRLRRYILSSPWTKDHLPLVEQIARYVISKEVWGAGKEHAPNRDLVPLALSAMARLELIRKDCGAARRVYLDYDFDQPGAEPKWHQDNVWAPIRLLCQPAPSLELKNWLHGRKPALWPGGGPADKLILLHFVDPADADSMGSLAKLSDLAERHADKLQVLSFVPVSRQLFDPQARKLDPQVPPHIFRKRVVDLTRDLSQPVGFLDQGKNAPIMAKFHARAPSTTVLVDRQGRVVAFAPTVTGGLEYVVEALADRK